MMGSDEFDLELAEMLREPDVWRESAEPPSPPPAIEAMVSLTSRLAEEDAAAIELLATVEKTPVAWWRTGIRKSAAGRGAGIVRQLLEQMRRLIAKSPLNALECTSIAVDLANDLGVIDYPGDFVIALRADAWRDHAYMLSFLGRTHEALAALDRAESLLGQLALPDFQMARTKLVRAHIYVVMDRQPEAITLAHEAAETFAEFGERSRYLDARTIEAAMLHEHGAVREALAIWDAIKDDDLLPEATRVHVVYDMGLAYRELGDLRASVELVTQAIAEYEMLGMDSEATRARWGLASTLVSAGKLADAIPLFETSWKSLERLGLETDAALAGLELAEVLLVIGRPERVPHICRDILDRFTRLGMTSRAITALSFLREVVAMGKAQPPIVRHVREFLRDLPTDGRSQLLLSAEDRER